MSQMDFFEEEEILNLTANGSRRNNVFFLFPSSLNKLNRKILSL